MLTKKKGFSLVELMLSLLLGSVLLAMVIGLYVTGVSSGAKSLKYSRLHTDLGVVPLNRRFRNKYTIHRFFASIVFCGKANSH